MRGRALAWPKAPALAGPAFPRSRPGISQAGCRWKPSSRKYGSWPCARDGGTAREPFANVGCSGPNRVFSSVRAPVCPQPWTGVLGPPHAPGCLSLVLSLKLPADLIWGLVQDPHTWLAGSISLITSPTPLFSILISLSLPPCLCLCCLSLSVPVSVSHLFVSVSPIPPCLSLSQSLGSISPTHLTTLVHPKIAPLDRSAQGAPWS